MKTTSSVFVAGHGGLVGSAIVRALRREGHENILVRGHSELELTNQEAVDRFFREQRPEYVFLAAARVGGILVNDTRPADFIRDNLAIQLNVIDSARRHGTGKLLFLGSSCIYPKHAPQPMNEDHLLTGPLEPTNEWYAIAKIAGLKMCQAYRRQYGFNAISLMPTNLYGPGDNFSLKASHVLPALIRKFHEAKLASAKTVEIWGTGKPRREFLHVDDLADACVFMMRNYDAEQIVNIGWGDDVSILELAERVKRIVGYDGGLSFDTSKPDGTPRKLLDTTRARTLGWSPTIALDSGLGSTYQWFQENITHLRD